jgi:hypothetical protein
VGGLRRERVSADPANTACTANMDHPEFVSRKINWVLSRADAARQTGITHDPAPVQTLRVRRVSRTIQHPCRRCASDGYHARSSTRADAARQTGITHDPAPVQTLRVRRVSRTIQHPSDAQRLHGKVPLDSRRKKPQIAADLAIFYVNLRDTHYHTRTCWRY